MIFEQHSIFPLAFVGFWCVNLAFVFYFGDPMTSAIDICPRCRNYVDTEKAGFILQVLLTGEYYYYHLDCYREMVSKSLGVESE